MSRMTSPPVAVSTSPGGPTGRTGTGPTGSGEAPISPGRAPAAAPTGTAVPPGAGTGAGIAGVTVMSGTCPAARAEQVCPDKPVTSRLAVLDATEQSTLATLDSGADGHFSLAIGPGRYVIRGISVGGSAPRRPLSMSVTVDPGHVATVTVRFDSGIR
jgi:hypothetical protein